MSRALRALLAAVLAAIAVVAMAPVVHADERIREFAVDATVNPDGTMQVVERITYDFDFEQRHGIYRLIPVWDELPDGSRWIHPVSVQDVTMDNGSVPYEISESGAYLEVKVGDPDTTITGIHEYVISYSVEGVMRGLTAEDLAAGNPYGFSVGDAELYWDFTGDGWDVWMADVVVRVSGPGAVLAAQCFRGSYGQTNPCQDRIQGDSVQFATSGLTSYEGMTGVVMFPGTAFSAPQVRRVEAAPLSERPGDVFIHYGLAAAVVGLVAPALIVLALRRRLRRVPVPSAVVRFGPPDNLRPAEIAVGLDGQLPARAVLATLLDLAARKYITISSDDGGIFRPGRIDLAWWGAGSDTTRPWEQKMLGAVFEGRDRATLQGYDPEFAKAVVGVQADLRREAILADRFDAEAKAVRGRFTGVAVLFLVATVVLFFAGIWSENTIVFVGLLPACAGATVGLYVARFFVPDRETVATAISAGRRLSGGPKRTTALGTGTRRRRRRSASTMRA
ncbi:MAG: DUF2207 domain-containing protein, partial [Actinomycetota bacterium]